MVPTTTSFIDLLHSVDYPFEAENDFGFDEPNFSEDTSSESIVGEDSDDVCETPVLNFMNDIGDVGDVGDFEENCHIDVWKESENKITLGMQFESKQHLKKAATLWSISRNREFRVYESKSNSWVAKCKTLGDEAESSNTMHYTPRCAWYVRAIKKKKTQHMWTITRWVDAHNCFGHIRSNLMKRYNNLSLKTFCWAIGSTTQKRKFIKCMREIKAIKHEAWQYLRQIDKSQWCLLYDENRRWGSLTTNISESMNNALRGARQLPIKACIDLTFNRTVQLFRKHSEIAMNCNTPLPSRMWRLFVKRETHAQSHTLTEFDYNEGVYRIDTKLRINETGGNTHTVHYFQHSCTCGKWQMERFPCSHALAVCRHRGDEPLSIVNAVYTTMTYKQQYNSDFAPLSHVDYWLESNWKIEANYSKLSVHTGRRRVNRFHNV